MQVCWQRVREPVKRKGRLMRYDTRAFGPQPRCDQPLVFAGGEMNGDGKVFEDSFTWSAKRPAIRPADAPRHHEFVPTVFHHHFAGSIAPALHIYPGDTVHATLTLNTDKELKIQQGRVSLLCNEWYEYREETTDSEDRTTVETRRTTDSRAFGQYVFFPLAAFVRTHRKPSRMTFVSRAMPHRAMMVRSYVLIGSSMQPLTASWRLILMPVLILALLFPRRINV